MYELLIGITVASMSATILCGWELLNEVLIEKGRKPICIPLEWFY